MPSLLQKAAKFLGLAPTRKPRKSTRKPKKTVKKQAPRKAVHSKGKK